MYAWKVYSEPFPSTSAGHQLGASVATRDNNINLMYSAILGVKTIMVKI